jgi:hypothetical protein
MLLNEMYTEIPRMRELFKGYLECMDGTVDKLNLKKFLRECLDECGSQFEEQTLEENLKEEFGLYMENLKGIGA